MVARPLGDAHISLSLAKSSKYTLHQEQSYYIRQKLIGMVALGEYNMYSVYYINRVYEE